MTASTVLLYSGGLDSHCAAYLWRPELLLYVRTGAPYEPWELAHINANASALVAPLLVVDGPYLQRYARADALVPQRNAFIVMLAAMHGDTIAMAVTEGDGTTTATDKDHYFRAAMCSLLRKMWDGAIGAGRGEVKLVLPWKNMTKAELVRRALHAGMPPAEAIAAPSCYGATDCGHCKACQRKWIALECNDLECHMRDVASESISDRDIQLAKDGRYRLGEGTDMLRALRKIGRLA